MDVKRVKHFESNKNQQFIYMCIREKLPGCRQHVHRCMLCAALFSASCVFAEKENGGKKEEKKYVDRKKEKQRSGLKGK